MRHAAECQKGVKKAVVGAATTEVVLLFYLIVGNVDQVPQLHGKFGAPGAPGAEMLWPGCDFPTMPGPGCVAPVTGLSMIAGPAQGRPRWDQLFVRRYPNWMWAA